MLKSKGIRFLFLCLCSAFLVSGLSAGAYAMPILVGTETSPGYWTTGPDSDGREATAFFGLDSSGNYVIDLYNVASFSKNPNQVLVGLIFEADLGTNGLPSPMVRVASDSSLISNGLVVSGSGGNDISGEWSYRTDDMWMLSEGRGNYGLSASSFDGDGAWDGFFGENYLLDNNNLGGSVAPGGADYGLLGFSYKNPPLNKTYVYRGVTISFGEITSNPEIKQVHFLYGTDYIPAVPEPTTILLLSSGLIGLAGFRRRRFF